MTITIYTEPEFCKIVGISRATAFKLRDSGELSFCKVGRKIFYKPEHIQEFFDRHERRASSVKDKR